MPDTGAFAQKTVLLSLVAMAALLPILVVGAADISVNEGCALADAIEAANNDTAVGGCPAGAGADRITLTGDITLAATLPAISSEISIAGANYTISGAGEFNIFEVLEGTLTVSNLTMIAGNSRYGGAIFGNNANLTVTDSVLRGNTSEVSGGAIAAQWGALTVSGTTFEDNVAQGAAGAIVVLEAQVSISDSDFNNNQAYFNGAIGNQGGDVTITNSAFRDNSSDLDGGAIGGEDAPLTIIDSKFSNNRAQKNGGAIFYQEGAVVISASEFDWNAAEGYGGALYGENLALTISDSAIRGSSAVNSGGAMELEGGTLIIAGSEISGTETGNIGSISMGGVNADISNSTLKNNKADSGGAILAYDSNVSIRDSMLSENSAKFGGGGAILGLHSTTIEVLGSSIIANESEFGGAFALSDSSMTIRNSALLHNVAAYGGALADFGDPAAYVISNSTFSGNRGTTNGGVLTLFMPSSADITHVTMMDNTAEFGNSIVQYEDATIRLRNTIVAGDWGQCAGTLTENVNSLVSDGSCATALDGDPMLGDLVEPADGSPPYFPLKPGSLMINAALDSFCSEQDQIGTARPQGSSCDIGAIEYDPAIPEGECRITTTHVLRFRASPRGSVIGSVLEGSAHSALDFADGWYHIEHEGTLGWISADYVVEEGDCAGAG